MVGGVLGSSLIRRLLRPLQLDVPFVQVGFVGEEDGHAGRRVLLELGVLLSKGQPRSDLGTRNLRGYEGADVNGEHTFEMRLELAMVGDGDLIV